MKIKCIALSGLFLARAVFATPTEIQYLSGTGKDATVDWRFKCSDGAKSGEWTTIPVPSCWEQEGFGLLSYGRDKSRMSKESGVYEHTFAASNDWKNKRINIVFEGSMTDTTVSINGQSAGPVHQGASCRFKYDVTELLKYGAENKLRVDVQKFSAGSRFDSRMFGSKNCDARFVKKIAKRWIIETDNYLRLCLVTLRLFAKASLLSTMSFHTLSDVTNPII